MRAVFFVPLQRVMNEHKIINDPVFGFIKIRRGLLYDIVQHPLFQRLNRIVQLGLASVVYPGARHTRFQHSLGALHLMSEAVKSLTEKGIYIFDMEEEAVQAAILMHDIGHGPFSHVLENTLISGISHEEISLMMMEQINRDLKGQLNLAISIFKDEYPNKIFHQLISSQLDMDRKGIYSVENYLTTRRLMYWQVYLHKTTVGYEKILVNALKRAKLLAREGREIFASPALGYFLNNDIDAAWFDSHEEALSNYAELDDSDIWSALKVWRHHDDKILATLATDLVDRRLFKVEVTEEPPTEEYLAAVRSRIVDAMGISNEDASYMMSLTEIGKDMYNPEDDSIGILYKDGTVRDIAEASEILNVQLLSKKIRKYYLCYQRV